MTCFGLCWYRLILSVLQSSNNSALHKHIFLFVFQKFHKPCCQPTTVNTITIHISGWISHWICVYLTMCKFIKLRKPWELPGRTWSFVRILTGGDRETGGTVSFDFILGEQELCDSFTGSLAEPLEETGLCFPETNLCHLNVKQQYGIEQYKDEHEPNKEDFNETFVQGISSTLKKVSHTPYYALSKIIPQIF